MQQFPHQWLPRKLIEDQGSYFCQWLFAGKKLFTEPFFSDSVFPLLELKENSEQKFLTPLNEFQNIVQELQYVPPSAFIFHISRCGSTLLSQLLSIDHSNIVLSEVPFLDSLLRLPYRRNNSIAQANAQVYFKAAVKAYGQIRTGYEKNLFIKTDSWHLFFYRQLRKLYPNIPFILLYRSPDEVIRSQNRHRGMQSVPGTIEPELFGFTDADATVDFDLYMSRVLEKFSAVIVEAAERDPHCYLFNYNQGFQTIFKQVLELTSGPPSKEYMQQATERCRFHSKSPTEPFEEANTADKDFDFLQSCFTWYRKMEQKRLNQTSYTEK